MPTVQRTSPYATGGLGFNSDVVSIQAVRVTTGSVPASSQAEVSVTWPQKFADINYTISAAVEEATATTDTLKVLKVVSRSASDCVVRVQNVNASARTGTLHVVAIGD